MSQRGGGSGETPTPRRVFRGVSGVIGLIGAGVVALLLVIDVIARSGWIETFVIAPWLALIVWLIYVAVYASHIAVDGSGITVQNLLRRTFVPWSQVADIDFKFQVRVVLVSGKAIAAFGGPIAGRSASRGVRIGSERGPSSTRRDLEVIREWRQDATETGAPDGVVRRSWDAVGVVSLAVIAVWLLSVLLWRAIFL